MNSFRRLFKPVTKYKLVELRQAPAIDDAIRKLHVQKHQGHACQGEPGKTVGPCHDLHHSRRIGCGTYPQAAQMWSRLFMLGTSAPIRFIFRLASSLDKSRCRKSIRLVPAGGQRQ
jgi:hypothetical protein